MSSPNGSASPFTRAMSRKEEGEGNWSCKHRLSEGRCRRLSKVCRELHEVLRGLAPLERQGKVEGFFNDTENAAQLGDLVEDIRDAMIDYQVCTSDS